jgi:hypothetical protein
MPVRAHRGFVTIVGSRVWWERRNVTRSAAASVGERGFNEIREIVGNFDGTARNGRDSVTKPGEFQAKLLASKAKLCAAEARMRPVKPRLYAGEARMHAVKP